MTRIGSPGSPGGVPTDAAALAAATVPRIIAPDRSLGTQTGGTTVTAGILWLSGFTATRAMPITTLYCKSRGTAAVGTTLARMGLFAVDQAGNVTTVGRTANDPAIMAATFTDYPRPIVDNGAATPTATTTVTLTAGARYALGVLLVGSTTAAVSYGPVAAGNAVYNGWLPWQAMSVAAADIAPTYTYAALTAQASVITLAAY